MIKRLAMILVALLACLGVAIVVAVFVIPDHDEVTNNEITTDSALVIDLSVMPTTAAWGATGVQPGQVVDGEVTLANNMGSGSIYVDLSVTNDNAILADAIVVRAVSKNFDTCGSYLNPDGTPTSVTLPEEEEYLGPLSGMAAANVVGPAVGSTDRWCFSMVIVNGVDFVPLASQTNVTTLIFDSDDTP